MKKLPALFFLLSMVFFSCARYIDDVPPEDTSKRWLGYRKNNGDTIIVNNGFVYLTTVYHPGLAIGTTITSNNRLKGDFELKISFTSFLASGDYDFSDQLLFEFPFVDGGKDLFTAYLTKDHLYLQDSTGAGVSKNTVNRNGEFFMKRQGSDIHAWIRAGNDSLFFDRSNYYSKELAIKMGVFSGDNSSSLTSVHIDDVQITGGGGFVQSNTFDENTIRIME